MKNNIITNPTSFLNNNYFKNIIRLIPGSFYIKDVNGVYIACSQLVADMAGVHSHRDVIGKTDNDFVWKEHAKIYKKNDQEAINLGIAITTEEEITLYNGIHKIFIVIKAPLKDEHDCIYGIIGNSIDITEIKQREKELLEKQFLTESLLNSFIAKMPGSIYWKDLKGVYLGCNQFVADMAGVNSPLDIIGKTDDQLPWKEGINKWKENDSLVIQSENEIISEEPIVLPDGRKLIFLATKAPLKNYENKIVGIIGTSLDITEQKNIQIKLEKSLNEAKKLKENLAKVNNELMLVNEKLAKTNNDLALANEEKRRFMFVVATRIRNQLMGNTTVSQILRRTENLPPGIESLSQVLDQSTSKILNILTHVTDFNDLAYSEPEQLDIKHLLEYISYTSTIHLKNKPIIIAVEYDENIPNHLLGDEDKITRILQDLLRNAINYTDTGLVKSSIRMININHEHVDLKIIIADTGRGISKEKLTNLFNVFNADIKEDYRGGGLVLSLTKKLVESMGGKISVFSEVGKGTTFTIELNFRLVNTVSVAAHSHSNYPLNTIIMSNNPYLQNVLELFTLFKFKQNVTTDNLLTLNLTKDILNSSILFIDNHIGSPVMDVFIKWVEERIQRYPVFCVITGITIEDELTISFPENWTVTRLEIPLTPTSFHRQLTQEYEKWKKGDLSSLKYTISRQKPRCLIVEDQPVARYSLKISLDYLECQITESESSEQAEIILGEEKIQRFDIIFMDIELPGKNGLELTKLIRKNHIYAKVPIIAVTAFVTSKDEEKCAEAGFTDVLVKPVSIQTLNVIINKYVRRKTEDINSLEDNFD